MIFVWQTRRLLRADTESWGQAGYALTTCGMHGRTVKWLSDYRTRPGVEPWMLSNLSASLRAMGRHGRAVEVNRHALTLPPDRTRSKHLAWVALEDAITDGEEARQRAARFHAEIAPRIEKLDQPFRYLGVLTGQVLAVRAVAADPVERRKVYRAARETLKKERQPVAASFRRGNRALGRAERRARRRMSRDAGGWWLDPAAWVFSWPGFVVSWPILAVVYIVAKLIIVLGATFPR